MMPLDVVWWNGCRGTYDQGMLVAAIEGWLSRDVPQPYAEQFRWNTPSQLPDSRGCILIVHGGGSDPTSVLAFVQQLDWCLIIVTSDEENKFPWKRLEGNHRKVWVQHPVPQRGGFDANRVFFTGWRVDTVKILAGLPKEKTQLWSYCGQVNNRDRESCVAVLRIMNDGFLHLTDGFAKGLPYEECLAQMARSKLVPSPAGLWNTDCFRTFEALEAGALPIVAVRPATHPDGFNYWEKMTGKSPSPIPLIEDWKDFPAIAEHYRNAENLSGALKTATDWWKEHKHTFALNLARDANELRRGVS